MSMARIVCDHRHMERLVETSGPSIAVPPGISLKPIIKASIPVATNDVGALSEDDLAHANFRLEYSETSSRYEIASFGLDRRNAAIEITGALWRTVRVHSIARSAIELALPVWVTPITRMRVDRVAGRLPDGLTLDTSDSLLLAATAYRVAEISNENAALAVAETLGLKQRTATNWIVRARDAGFMTTTSHAKDLRRIAEEIERHHPWATSRTPDESAEDLAPLRMKHDEATPPNNR